MLYPILSRANIMSRCPCSLSYLCCFRVLSTSAWKARSATAGTARRARSAVNQELPQPGVQLSLLWAARRARSVGNGQHCCPQPGRVLRSAHISPLSAPWALRGAGGGGGFARGAARSIVCTVGAARHQATGHGRCTSTWQKGPS